MSYDRKIVAACLLLALLIGCFTLLNILFPLPKERLSRDSAPQYLDRHGQVVRIFLAPDDSWHLPLSSLDRFSPSLQQAVLAYEDRWFYWHPGVNPISIAQALLANFRAKRIVRGGSTITMQLARLIEPKSRTIPNKLVEVFRAIQIELTLSKRQILTAYFNLAPYGGNIVGASAASQAYFGKSVDRLSPGESALLACLPNSPTRLRPDLYPQRTQTARNKVLRRMLGQGKIDLTAFREAYSEPIPDQRQPMPFRAPHLTRFLHNNPFLATPTTKPDLSTGSTVVRTTIDLQIQTLAEGVLNQHLGQLRQQDISTGAVVVMDTQTRQVLAWVGSNNFFARRDRGQVDGVLAPRSPGSALKPFVYALALDSGEITPASLLNDVPVDYAGYHPDNYDGQHRGYVTVQQALAESLNVPAVQLYASLKDDGLYAFLQQAGVTTLTEPKSHYGLPLILGSAEVNLLELTSLYCGLANLGSFAPCHLILDQPLVSKEQQLLGREACYILSEMLSEVRRPDLPSSYESTLHLPKVAWKTGTSYGHRDAWSVGYTPDLTVGVWVGNFDGHGAPALVGSEVAAPILFDLFRNLQGQQRWFRRPYQVNQRKICTLSGMITTDACPKTRTDFYIVGISHSDPCQMHRRVVIDDQTGFRLCSHCRVGRSYQRQTFEIWPPEISTWLNRRGIAGATIPKHNPNCNGVVSGAGPIIRSPTKDTPYKIRAGISLEFQKILLEASVSNQTQQVYWFLDGQLVSSGTPTKKVFIVPTVGKHNLTCIDDEGRSTTQLLRILN